MLRNDSQVTVYHGWLVASCSSYSQFTHDYDSVKHESAVAPFVILTFARPRTPQRRLTRSTTPRSAYRPGSKTPSSRL